MINFNVLKTHIIGITFGTENKKCSMTTPTNAKLFQNTTQEAVTQDVNFIIPYLIICLLTSFKKSTLLPSLYAITSLMIA